MPTPAKAAAPATQLSSKPTGRKVPEDPWQRVLDAQARGLPVAGTIKATNKGGVVVTVEGPQQLRGFIPFSKLDPSRIKGGDTAADLAYLVGQPVRAAVFSVDLSGERKELVLSETAVLLSAAMSRLKAGDVVDATVARLEDYGAFVEVAGTSATGPKLSGLIHKSELSWDVVLTAEQVVSVGQAVRAVVMEVDATRGRLALSLRRTTRDPLRQSLESLIWSSPLDREAAARLPAEVQLVLAALRAVPGIKDVKPTGRQAEEKHTVSQDVELYLTRAVVEDGFNIVARFSRVYTELHVSTSLSRAAMKDAIVAAIRGGGDAGAGGGSALESVDI